MIEAQATLLSARVVRVAAREFWLEEELCDAICIVFLGDDEGRSWRISYNDETWRWVTKPSQEPFPEIGSHLGDDAFEYRHAKLAGSDRVLGNRVMAVNEWSTDDAAYVEFVFENECRLKLCYMYVDDSSGFEFIP